MKEEFLHYVWKTRAYQTLNLKTTDGRNVDVLTVGSANRNAGPDFHNARVLIDDTIWAGSIEIHVHSSDWQLHKHDGDPLYNNVILHVVFDHDKEVLVSGSNLPTLELNHKIPLNLFRRYERMMHRLNTIKCSYAIEDVPEIIWISLKERKLLERLDVKKERIEGELNNQNGDWEHTALVNIARYFGGNVNADNFEMLFKSIPISLIRKYKHDLLKIEALIFGMAGMLNKKMKDIYAQNLLEEFRLIKRLHRLDIPIMLNWKFSRIRPAGFPTIRLAQLAMLIHQYFPLMNKLSDLKTEENIFSDIHASRYWDEHYKFDIESKHLTKYIGQSFRDNLLINGVVPLLYSYGFYYDNMALVHRAIDLLKNVPSEKNRITRIWKQGGLESKNAQDSQALIQLFHNDCSALNCLNCSIGHSILKCGAFLTVAGN